MTDAGFEDGAERPIALIAQSADDFPVLSSLLQDAVFPLREMAYVRPRRRFAILLSRFRWEDRVQAKAQGRAYERVQSLLVIHDVLAVRTAGIDLADKKSVKSLLLISFTASDQGAGTVNLTLAGGGAVALEVEAIDATLKDVTRPHLAKSVPNHGLDA
jgi:hypothetical protein